jgi:hypothetical protein
MSLEMILPRRVFLQEKKKKKMTIKPLDRWVD